MSLDNIIAGVIILCVYMWPLAIVAASDRTRGNEKTYWLLATIFLSWVALVAYWSTTLKEKERLERHRSKLEYEHKKELALKRKRLREQQAADTTGANEPQEQQDEPPPPPPHVEDSA